MRPKPIRRRLPEHRKPARETHISFSTTALEKLTADAKDYYVHDTKISGLNIKVTPVGRKVFLLRYSLPGKRGAKMTLGVFPRLSVPQARKFATAAWVEINAGMDPAKSNKEHLKAVTVKDFAKRYLEEWVNVRTSKSSQRDYASMLNNNVLPRIGHMRLEEVRRVDIENLHRALSKTPVRANRTIAVTKAMFNKAGDWEIMPYQNNPALRIKLNKEEGRERSFNSSERIRIGAALKELRGQNPMSQSAFDAIVFLFRTGCRTSEALGLRWQLIDYERCRATLIKSKTGKGYLHLGDDAIELLQSIASTSNSEWVFPGRTLDKPLKGIRRPWAKICEHAQITDARPHDIRHTVATCLGENGSVSSAQAILRHKNSKTTGRYINLHQVTILSDLNKAIKGIRKNGI